MSSKKVLFFCLCISTLWWQGPDSNSLFQNMPTDITANVEAKPLSSSIIRSHSVSGDLHGVQPDPVAADILRKEPEQESFARLKISPTGTASIFYFQGFKRHTRLAVVSCDFVKCVQIFINLGRPCVMQKFTGDLH